MDNSETCPFIESGRNGEHKREEQLINNNMVFNTVLLGSEGRSTDGTGHLVLLFFVQGRR